MICTDIFERVDCASKFVRKSFKKEWPISNSNQTSKCEENIRNELEIFRE